MASSHSVLAKVAAPAALAAPAHCARRPPPSMVGAMTDDPRAAPTPAPPFDLNHWILRPPHVRVWHETVLAFLDEHVLGKDWVPPGLL
jgi:hypothetical protein